ncbi:MAG: hypothetical protein AAGA56_25480, partial [Myxococcota bacterium]
SGEPAETVDVAWCPHSGGAPRCWCRPPLPGLAVAWARRRGVDLTRCVVRGGPSFGRLAETIEARWERS